MGKPKERKQWKDTSIKALSEPGRYMIDRGFHVRVTENLAKTFYLRKQVNGSRKDIRIGGYPDVSLKAARTKADQLRAAIENGEGLEVRESSVPTFLELATELHEKKSEKWRNEKVKANWLNRLKNHAGDILSMPIDKIDNQHVIDVLEPIWTSKPETGRKVKASMRQTFIAAVSRKYVNRNVIDDAVGEFEPMPSVGTNFRSLPYEEVPEALEVIRESRSAPAVRLCLEYVILVSCRNGEARHATWGEIDFEKALWTIPGSRTKNGKEHVQPLSAQAIAVLKQMHRPWKKDSDIVFSSPKKPGQPLSDMTLTRLLKNTGLHERCVVHGFRSSFRTYAMEKTNADYSVMELCLAHSIGDAVVRAYARGKLLKKRRKLLQKWADFISPA